MEVANAKSAIMDHNLKFAKVLEKSYDFRMPSIMLRM
jgi:hypothetical protein